MKKISVITALIAAAALCTSCGTASQNASQESSQNPATPLLIKSVTEYEKSYETGEWEEASKTEYTYENAYPVKIDRYEIAAEYRSVRTFEYTFENDLPATRKEYDEQGNVLSTTEYNKGRVYEINSIGSIDDSGARLLFQYTDDGPYFTAVLTAAYEPGYDMEEIDAIQITTKDGLLEKTTNCGLYANWNKGEEKEWMRFNGTYTALYDSDGIINRTDDVFRAGPQGDFDSYEVVKEDGKITTVVCSHTYEGREAEEIRKITFEYEDTEIDKVRYAAMMNEHIAGSGNNYYKYNWY